MWFPRSEEAVRHSLSELKTPGRIMIHILLGMSIRDGAGWCQGGLTARLWRSNKRLLRKVKAFLRDEQICARVLRDRTTSDLAIPCPRFARLTRYSDSGRLAKIGTL